ncbi:MAG TPA: hypothetical protein VLG69_00325 [Candidatus Andersenbacteria bacterium]|nr:hypothetical protein [Candidatus Andersenbacteria bacterium]
MESRARDIDALFGIAFLLSAGIVAWARYLHPATFSPLVYSFLIFAECICLALYYIRKKI